MGCEIGDAAYSIALNLDVLTMHLSDEVIKTVQLHYEKLIFGCVRVKGRKYDRPVSKHVLEALTVDCQIA